MKCYHINRLITLTNDRHLNRLYDVIGIFNFRLSSSKVMYLNERQTNSTRSWSDRIDLATKFQTYAERWGSENYQVMNYGIGGSIVGHLDSTGNKNFVFVDILSLYYI